MILLIDNYDSFVFNVEQYIRELTTEEVSVIRNDKITIDEIISLNPSKIILSPGPKYPKDSGICLDILKTLTDFPVLGICLGHQMLSIAHGYDTYKLKFGQHGGNHPVANNGVVEITAQNHNYNVPDNIVEIADVTHINLFDNTIEGVKYKNKEIFSVQHHPEASPGPHESKYIFKQFADIVK